MTELNVKQSIEITGDLIRSAIVKYVADQGYEVVGIDAVAEHIALPSGNLTVQVKPLGAKPAVKRAGRPRKQRTPVAQPQDNAKGVVGAAK